MNRMTSGQIDNIFSYHKPVGTQQDRYVAIREKAKELAHLINDDCPESREKSLALTDLQRCVQMANASIAINETTFDQPNPGQGRVVGEPATV